VLTRLPKMWRLLREIDLDAIRAEAERTFQIVVCAQEPGPAEALAETIGGGVRHPWVLPLEPEPAVRRARSGAVSLAVLRSPTVCLSAALAEARAALTTAGVPTIVVLDTAVGGMDLISREGEAGRVLLSAPDGPQAFLALLVAAAPPSLRVALARQLPPLRTAAFAEITEETARANALYALTMGLAEVIPLLGVPLNVADIVVLTKNQLMMGYRIALAAGKQGATRDVMGELLSVVGGGFLFRQVGRELVGLVPVIGVVPKVAVAYAGTLAISKVVVAWASEDHRLGPKALRRAYKEAWGRSKALARALLRGRRERGPLVLNGPAEPLPAGPPSHPR